MESYKNTKINLQNKAKAKKGTAEMYWFKNEFMGIERTLFYRITIPLEAFDSGLVFEEQPVKTAIVFEFLVLNLPDPTDLDGLIVSSETHEELETSVYVGGAHNWCDVIRLTTKRKKDNTYFIEGKLAIDFEAEGVAEKEKFTFKTTIDFNKNVENW